MYKSTRSKIYFDKLPEIFIAKRKIKFNRVCAPFT